MEEKKAHDDKHDGIRSVYLALYFIGALVSGVGGNLLWLRTSGTETVAPDRFTGTQAAALIQRVERLEKDVTPHLANYPQVLASFESRVAVLEAQYVQIINNQTRILDRIDQWNRELSRE